MYTWGALNYMILSMTLNITTMNRIFFILMIFPLVSLAGIDDIVLPEENVISPQLFVDKLKLYMEDTKGFACVLTKKGVVIAKVSDGYAQYDDINPKLDFTPNTFTNIGSVSKVITGIAMMQVLYQKGISAHSLIIDYLPKLWKERILEENINTAEVTIHQLLAHKSGFVDKYDGAITQYLFEGVDTESIDDYVYANPNYTILGAILGLVNGDLDVLQDDEDFAMQVGANEITMKEYDDKIENSLAAYYNNYIQEHIFLPIGIDASCDIKEFSKGNFALMYESKEDMEPGVHYGDLTSDTRCAVGGLAISMRQLSKIFAHFKYTNDLVNDQIRQNIFNNKYIFRSNSISDFGHNGAITPGGNASAFTIDEYQFAIATNTGNVTPDVLKQRAKNAFEDAKTCPEQFQNVYIDKITFDDVTIETGYNYGSYTSDKSLFIYPDKHITSFSLSPGFIDEPQSPLNWAIYTNEHSNLGLPSAYEKKLWEVKQVIGDVHGTLNLSGIFSDPYDSLYQFRIYCSKSEIYDNNTCVAEYESYSFQKPEPLQPIYFPSVLISSVDINGVTRGIDYDHENNLYGYPNSKYGLKIYMPYENTFKITSVYFGNKTLYWKLFIDYNANGVIEASEVVSSGQGKTFEGTFEPTFEDGYQEVFTDAYIVVREGMPVPDLVDDVDLGNAHIAQFDVSQKFDGINVSSPLRLWRGVKDITSTGAKIGWSWYDNKPNDFEINVFEVGGNWSRKYFVENEQLWLYLDGLKPNTAYAWNIKVIGEEFDYILASQTITFKTLSSKNCGTDINEVHANNDVKEHATPLQLGMPKYGLMCESEVDYFEFEVSSYIPKDFDIKLSGKTTNILNGVYYLLLFKDGQDEAIEYAVSYNNDPKELSATLGYGKYYVMVYGASIESKFHYYKLLVEASLPIQLAIPENGDQGYEIYPNPVVLDGVMTIQLNDELSKENIPYSLHDQYGMLVAEGISSRSEINLHGEITKPGLYYIKIAGQTERIVVE